MSKLDLHVNDTSQFDYNNKKGKTLQWLILRIELKYRFYIKGVPPQKSRLSYTVHYAGSEYKVKIRETKVLEI